MLAQCQEKNDMRVEKVATTCRASQALLTHSFEPRSTLSNSIADLAIGISPSDRIITAHHFSTKLQQQNASQIDDAHRSREDLSIR